MAERRMFAKTIVDSDAFLDMPLSSQALYFHLSMRADDEGFINNPRKIQRTIGASDDDLKLLIAKSFIIPFESGIVVIKHWKIHNYIRGDRIHSTKYFEEKSLLEVKENGAYTLMSDQCPSSDGQVTDQCLSDGSKMSGTWYTEVRLGKDSIGKDSIDNTSAENDKNIFIKLTLNDKSEYEVSVDDVNNYQELYPAVDVKQQLRSMKGWCDANPTNRKTRNGIKRFINGWLSKEQNRASVLPKENKFDANKGLIKGNYDFEALERETKSKGFTEDVPEISTEKKPESKLVAKMLSLPIGKDFRFVYQGKKEFYGTRYEKAVAIMFKGGDFKQIPIDKLEDYIDELPDYKEKKDGCV